MKVDVNDQYELEFSDVYNPIVIVTPTGKFGICQRDGGIEVVHQGKTIFCSYTAQGGEEK